MLPVITAALNRPGWLAAHATGSGQEGAPVCLMQLLAAGALSDERCSEWWMVCCPRHWQQTERGSLTPHVVAAGAVSDESLDELRQSLVSVN